MFDPNDFKVLIEHKNVKHYHLYCDKCNADRGYHQKSRSSLLCKRCKHAGKCYFDHTSPDFKEKMSEAKKGQSVWNAGTSKYTKEQRTIRTNLSSAIRIRLNRRNSSKKGDSYLEKLGYTIEQLKVHLESKFYPNPRTGEAMSWDNWSHCGWHIDHVIPDSWFTYQTMDDQAFKDSWALSNLQPKWAFENFSKNNRFVG